jgi:S-adenosylmethionine decarboxylase proenzyme
MAEQQRQDVRYAIDIRVFVVVIVMAMAISFGVGVGMGPTAEELMLPKVTSVHLEPPALPEGVGAEDLHEPAGQHLLVDIKGIESDFLDSEERLSKAMVDTVTAAGLTMLSYHCHSLVPKGVSCVGVLLESHISFHTWPDEGVITLDLFTCGSKPLIPVVTTLKQLFGIGDNIHMQWSHELRGFRKKKHTLSSSNDDGKKQQLPDDDNYALLDHNSDLSQMIWSPIDVTLKEQVVSTLTTHQRVDIWDLVGLEETPSYEDVLRHNLQAGDPRWTTSEIVAPTRHLFLDGVLQSESSSQRELHEALVHPGMFSHPHPKNVAIVGGAEGATLREVLKHKTVESVTMIEIDQELVELVREYMPYMSNCTDLVGRADNCFDDELTHLVLEDAQQWFVDRYGEEPTKEPEQLFDVVIVDAIEPEMSSAGISKDLYDNANVLRSILKSLTFDGILAIQIGRAPTILDPRPDIGFNAPREMLFQTLESLEEVQAMFVYEDPHCGFLEPKAFMIVCKSVTCRRLFYATSDEMDYQIYDRVVRTHNKNERALVYFDGVTHLGYQVAPKAWETIYCRREPTPFECAYRHLDFSKELFEFDIENEDTGPFKVTAEWADGEEKEIEQTHVFATVNIPKGSYIMPEHMASSLSLSHQAIENLRGNLEYGGVTVIEDFVKFIDEFGHESQAAGSARTLVEIGASYFIEQVDEEELANVGRWIPPHPSGNGERPKYSPVYERHRLSFDVFLVATKDISAGQEILKYIAK